MGSPAATGGQDTRGQAPRACLPAGRLDPERNVPFDSLSARSGSLRVSFPVVSNVEPSDAAPRGRASSKGEEVALLAAKPQSRNRPRMPVGAGDETQGVRRGAWRRSVFGSFAALTKEQCHLTVHFHLVRYLRSARSFRNRGTFPHFIHLDCTSL